MHPQIRSAESGQCPLCGMDLIVSGGGGDPDSFQQFELSESAAARARVETVAVERRPAEKRISLAGTIDFDQTRTRSLTARFPARIDELFVNFKGVSVGLGEHLARVYSPELVTAQKELLLAFERDPEGRFVQAARQKLLQWDLLEEQVEEIIQAGEASELVELKAPVGGVVIDQLVSEGDYVNTGTTMFRIADLTQLWLMLQAYESDLKWLRLGQVVTFTVEAYPGETFEGKVSFISPELDMATRVAHVRVNVSNDSGRLKPGMFVRATASVRLASGGLAFAPEYAGKWISPMHPEIVKDEPGQCDVCGMDLVSAESLGYVSDPDAEPPIVVPTSAVLRTGKRALVYVATKSESGSAYERREIVIGPRAGDVFTVVSGLEEGEQVVSRGAFKIDSAMQIQGLSSMMQSSSPLESLDELDLETARSILPLYLKIQDALAADDAAAARENAVALHELLGHDSPLDSSLHGIESADGIEEMRRPHFEILSAALIESVERDPAAFEEDLWRMNCPMVYPDRGADWLQSDATLRNPYFGASMLSCGTEVRRY